MRNTSHTWTPEPWHQDAEGMIVDAAGKDVSFCDANVERYVACVNALAGWTAEDIAALPSREAIRAAREALEACIPNLEIARNRMGMECTSIDLARRALAALDGAR